MNKRQENKYTMYLGVWDLLEKNKHITGTVAPMAAPSIMISIVKKIPLTYSSKDWRCMS